LRVLVLGCTAVGLLLGAFALAGDQLGLWQPVEPPPATVVGVERGNGSRPSGRAEASSRELPAQEDPARPPPGPPLPARTAFLLAALAALVGLLGSAATTLPRMSHVRHARAVYVRLGRLRFPRAQAVRGQMPRYGARERAGSGALRSAPSVLRRTLSALPRWAHAIAVAAWTWTRPSLAFLRGVVSSDFRATDYGPGGREIYILAVVLGIAIGWLVVHGADAMSGP